MIEKIKDPPEDDHDFELAEPATPRQQSQRNVRDYFAGQIIGGRMSIPDRSLKDAEFFVGDVFDLADRMLRESIKRGGW